MKKDMKKFVKEFEMFNKVWEEGRSSNPKDISEEFALKGFVVYKQFALSENSEVQNE